MSAAVALGNKIMEAGGEGEHDSRGKIWARRPLLVHWYGSVSVLTRIRGGEGEASETTKASYQADQMEVRV